MLGLTFFYHQTFFYFFSLIKYSTKIFIPIITKSYQINTKIIHFNTFFFTNKDKTVFLERIKREIKIMHGRGRQKTAVTKSSVKFEINSIQKLTDR